MMIWHRLLGEDTGHNIVGTMLSILGLLLYIIDGNQAGHFEHAVTRACLWERSVVCLRGWFYWWRCLGEKKEF